MSARKKPLEGHPRAAETRAAMLAAKFEDETEVMDLQASELVCELADAWAADRMAARCADVFEHHPKLAAIIDRIELITRPSGMRKNRP